MPQLLIALLILGLAYYGLKFFAKASPAIVARTVRLGGGGLAGLAGLFLLLRGRPDLGIAGIGFGLWLTGFFKLPGKGAFSWRPPRSAGQSEVRSALISMKLDHGTGAMEGAVIAGPQNGRSLATMTRPECLDLYRLCLSDDPDGARLLEPYLDRRFTGWREAGQSQRDTGRADRGRFGTALSEEDAYGVLGLRQGATRDDIVRAHRALMKKMHPDYGGATELAARVNEAKEVLLRRTQ